MHSLTWAFAAGTQSGNIDEVSGKNLSLFVKNDLTYMGLDAKKPVFGVSDKVRFKTACSAKDTS